MRRIFLFVAAFVLLTACEKADCWVFTTKTTLWDNGLDGGEEEIMPIETTEKCGLTEKEADMVVERMTRIYPMHFAGIGYQLVLMKTTKKKK